ncbi:MAG TPA: hypothetical protein VF329_09045 [Gammaproteobacteria bacterium]
MSSSAFPESIEQIHELNRLFLRSLQGRDVADLRGCGFPGAAVASLRAAPPGMLDAVAEFPRALFELTLDESGRDAPQPDMSRQILDLTIVFCAWNMARESLYHARLLFGLTPQVAHELRTTPLSQLPRLALTRARISCTFAEVEWLWKELLTETRPEARRQLILIALQPPIDAAGVADAAQPKAAG